MPEFADLSHLLGVIERSRKMATTRTTCTWGCITDEKMKEDGQGIVVACLCFVPKRILAIAAIDGGDGWRLTHIKPGARLEGMLFESDLESIPFDLS